MKEYFNIQLSGYNLEAIKSSLYNQMMYWSFLFGCIILTREFDTVYVEVTIFIVALTEALSVVVFYDIPLLVKLDRRFNKIVRKKVILEKLEREEVLEKKDFKSRVEEFFPREFGADRYKLYYISDERFGDIRLILGYDGKNMLKEYIANVDDPEKLTFNISYLRFSKVLYEITPCEDSEYKKEQQELIDSVFVLEKPIGLINGFRFANNRK